MLQIRRIFHNLLIVSAAALSIGGTTGWAYAGSVADLETDSAQSLSTLYKNSKTAELMGRQAKAILVFPNVIKAGLIFGGSYGEGVLMRDGKVVDYYNSVSGSWGWQAGAESYAYVVFLMSDKAVKYLTQSKGWEFGVGPTVVAGEAGMAKNISTSTLQEDAYAFISDQQGLMVSLSIEGTKISQIKKP